MLLHETRNDDGIRAFFNDVWECYVKTLLNPFYAVDKVIQSNVFENRVKAIAKVSSALQYPLFKHIPKLNKAMLIPFSDIYNTNHNCCNTFQLQRDMAIP